MWLNAATKGEVLGSLRKVDVQNRMLESIEG
jgi:hypothetical protein